MKKKLSLILLLVLMFSLTGCASLFVQSYYGDSQYIGDPDYKLEKDTPIMIYVNNHNDALAFAAENEAVSILRENGINAASVSGTFLDGFGDGEYYDSTEILDKGYPYYVEVIFDEIYTYEYGNGIADLTAHATLQDIDAYRNRVKFKILLSVTCDENLQEGPSTTMPKAGQELGSVLAYELLNHIEH